MSRRTRITRFLATTMAVGFIVFASGCATDDDIFKLRVEVKEAKGAAERADQAANMADSKANASLRLATEAVNTAAAARACCVANTEKRTNLKSMMGGS